MSERETPTAVPDSSVPGEAATVAGSVIASLREKGKIRHALQLDLGGARDSGEDAKAGGGIRDALGRYSVLGEIARGGVGIVLRGRDPDLGRDVAVKVLRDEHLANDSVLQRFIEEAQIGAQMQHPGIVPVYEMGLASGDRPYFSMKLVKGETLAAKLSSRTSLEDGRRQLIGVFESVCATMAYAHARGVVHRDLKPSNIMIGSYGQILVVDWGLAKVRGRGGVADERDARRAQQPKTIIATVRSETAGSESMVGSVMGTPGYMPPEQARGDVDQMDERSDVFALGAILCEILTGSPPYIGKDMEMVMMAARAELDGARKRLAECGADAPLVNLALKCLAPSPLDRPRDAREVHASLRAHESKIAARAQQARRAAVEASIRAAEARRSRRLTNVLVASVLGAVVVLGGGGFAYSAARSSRLAGVREQVGVAMGEAAELQGRATSTHDVADWSAARLAAQRTLEIAQAGDADPETMAAAEALVASVESAQRDAIEEDSARQRDEALLADLDAVRLAAWDLDPSALDQAYADAFGAYGIAADDIARAGAALATSPIAARIASGLSAWADARHAAGGDESALRALVTQVDTDPWHTALRDATELAQLRRLAEEADVDVLPVESLGRLVERLSHAGDVAAAIDVAERAVRSHPHDPWLRSQLAILLLDLPVPRTAAALDHSAVLTSLLPGSASAWANRAHVLQTAGRTIEALAAANRAIELNPENALGRAQLARVHIALNDPESAERELDKALELDDDLALAHIERARFAAARDDRAVAREHFERALQLEPNSARAHTEYGRVLGEFGDFHGAVQALERALEIDPGYVEARGLLAELRIAVCDDEGAAQQLAAYLEARPTSFGHLTLLTACLGRMGDDEGCRDEYAKLLRLLPTNTAILNNAARAHFALGEFDQATSLLSRATLLGGVSYTDAELTSAYVLKQRVRRLPDDQMDKPIEDLKLLLDGLAGRLRTLETKSDARALKAWMEERKGRFAYAVDEYEPALTFASSDARREDLNRRVARDRRLKLLAWDKRNRGGTIQRGVFEAADAAETLDCGWICDRTSYFTAAAQYCETAFDLDPSLAEDLEAGNRALAAWCAALASAGLGNVPEGQTERDRSRLRRRALDWMRDELFAWRSRFEADPDRNWGPALSWAMRIYDDIDLSVVRSKAALAGMSDAERNAFERFWSDVHQLRRDAAARLLGGLGSAEDPVRFLEQSCQPKNNSWVASCIDLIASRLKGRKWGVEQLTGAPTAVGACFWPGTWCPKTENGGEEWIELEYDEPVIPESIGVHEASGAGAVTRIQVREAGGEWTTVWEGPPKPAVPLRVFRPRLATVDHPVSEVRVEFDTARIPGWVQIDCVELVGSGLSQWARSARASSQGTGD